MSGRGEPRSSIEAASLVMPLIEGRLLPSSSDEQATVYDPSVGRPFISIPRGCALDADRAVVAARRAFDGGAWSEAAPQSRKDTLHRLADRIAGHAAALDELDAREMGKPVREQFGSALAAASLMRFYAEAADKITGDTYSSDRQTFVAQRRVPRGVVAAIVPWNFPVYNAVLKIAPALAAGNSVVLKPSELSTRSAVRLAQFALEAGLPPGVFNVVPGLGETVGRALAVHRDVDMVAFTGSTEVGGLMLQYAGQSNMKVVLTECGGKSPHVVFDDGVDLDAVAGAIASGLLINQGQLCSVGSRVLAHRSIERLLVEKIVAQFERIQMGNALDANTTFGPLASARQCARVMDYIESARVEGVEILTGGSRALEESGGYFVKPTLLRVTSTSARVAQEEIFGPVLCVTAFEREEDAVRLANGTRFGLAAYVWTANLATGMRMLRSIRSSVFINACAPRGPGPGHACSAEPAGESGIGVEGGLAGLEGYLRRQLVWFSY